jgi:N,N-dimethylformamidase
MHTIRIRGYCDIPSVAPGETISFYVSSEDPGEYQADLVRLIHGDTNPAGPGYKEDVLASPFAGRYSARFQRTQFGSYVEIPDGQGGVHPTGAFTVHAFIWSTTPSPTAPGPRLPTAPFRPRQGVLSRWADDAKAGWALTIEDGSLVFSVGDGNGNVASVKSDKPLFAEVWYSVAASYDPAEGSLTLHQRSVVNRVNSVFGPIVPLDSDTTVVANSSVEPADAKVSVLVAGLGEASNGGRTWCVAHYNGKVDSPKVYGCKLDEVDVARLANGETVRPLDLLAAWNFAHGIGPKGIPTDRVADVSGKGLHGFCVNQPDRGMTGWNWQGMEEHFIHAPEQYGAIWFHEDSLDDCRWDADFTWTVPKDTKSDCYAVRLRQGGTEDYIPFFVVPPRGTATAKILFLVATCSYLAYANGQVMQNASIGQAVAGHVPVLNERDIELHQHPEYYGLSTYDYHADGRGVAYSSWRRPLLNMRPKHRQEFGSLWQFPADLHLVDWLNAMGFEYDVATDHDLIREGADLFKRYNVVLTGSHPEYYSTGMVDAWEDYLCAGGRGMYLASNGIYWIASTHPEKPWVMEVRKGETGAAAWKARPGELFHSTTGERGGLWRQRARATQKIWGTGFSSFGFDHSGYFVQMPDAQEERASWIMEGIAQDETIGDFGLVGGGAAGYELDRYDLSLGTPPHSLLLASSVSHSSCYVVVNEDQYFPHPGMCGGEHPYIRADIVYFTTPNGGAMFSSSSISWCGSLSWNNYENNVSRMMNNVLTQFAKDVPAPGL